MLRFIFFCMAFTIISFFAVPVYFGISKTHSQLEQTAATRPQLNSLTFEQIYALADENLMRNPSLLNNIEPAAEITTTDDKFSVGFSGKEDSALADQPLSF